MAAAANFKIQTRKGGKLAICDVLRLEGRRHRASRSGLFWDEFVLRMCRNFQNLTGISSLSKDTLC